MRSPLTLAAAACFVLFGAACVHTPPGTSVEIALAKKPELVKLPMATPAPALLADRTAPEAEVPAVEPPMPETHPMVERVADAYSRGTFSLEAGRDPEAITAFEEAVALDPGFSEVWQKLAMLYEKAGDPKKAMEAFKKAKTLARQ